MPQGRAVEFPNRKTASGCFGRIAPAFNRRGEKCRNPDVGLIAEIFVSSNPSDARRSQAMATVLDALQSPANAPQSEHEPVARLPNLVALLRRRTESATDGPLGCVPPTPETDATERPETYAKN
jgi:hypothetical protein